MLLLQSSIAPHLKVLGFRKRSRTWWRTSDEVVSVLNLQKSPYGDTLYINLGVYVKGLGQESQPSSSQCHLSVRLESISASHFWDDIVGADSVKPPSSGLIEAVLKDGVSWLESTSTKEGIRKFILAGGSKKAIVTKTIREFVGAE